MSFGFLCGANGCDVVELDGPAMREASRQRHAWATNQRLLRGEYPPVAEQEDYWIAAYTRLTEIKKIEKE